MVTRQSNALHRKKQPQRLGAKLSARSSKGLLLRIDSSPAGGRRIPISIQAISELHSDVTAEYRFRRSSLVSKFQEYQIISTRHTSSMLFFRFVIIFVALRCILNSWSSSSFLLGCLLRFLFHRRPSRRARNEDACLREPS